MQRGFLESHALEKMSGGKRIAKRSILGTRVMAPRREDGMFFPGVIQAQKNREISPNNEYVVKFDDDEAPLGVFSAAEIVGPGFESVHSVKLQAGQTVYLTHCQREIQGTVIRHDVRTQDVILNVSEGEPILKKIDDVRLIESRKSARLINSDTDFSKLADINITNEKKKTKDLDIPRSDYVKIAGSRKRRTSDHIVDEEEVMTECTAAMVLMKLSCSPSSWNNQNNDYEYFSSSGSSSFRSSTPSPPLSTSASTIDEGIVKDFSIQSSSSKVIYQCTYPGCNEKQASVNLIESHVRRYHLHRPDPLSSEVRDHEEEFYYTEIEEEEDCSSIKNKKTVDNVVLSGTASLADHLDMARPAHEDPGAPLWKNNIISALNHNFVPRARSMTMPITIASSNASPSKLILISPSERSQTSKSLVRRGGRDGKKCRKVYGLEQRDLWCTQCKWKKACARFGANATETATPPLAMSSSKINFNANGFGYRAQQTSSPILLATSAPVTSSTSLLGRKIGVKALNL